jgi:glycosyltransferase involved in cell wall biosynthesis
VIQAGIPNIAIEVVGSGDDEPRLRQRAIELGVASQVRFAGYVPTARKVEILRRSWAVVCPSLKEGWGLTNIEANACGTPVVCADVPGLRDSARDGESALLYPYGDIAALAERLKRLISDKDLRERLALGGIQWAENFHWETAARETELILGRVAQGERRIGMTAGERQAGAERAA